MPIDFKCNSCSHLIRVPDGTEGKKTMCPKCSVAQQIPGGSAPAEPETPGIGGNDFSDQANFGSSAGASDFAPDPTNPYASPETGYQPDQHTTTINGKDFTFRQADLGSIINDAFECWKERLGILLGTFIVAILLYLIVYIVQQVLIAVAAQFAPIAIFFVAVPLMLFTIATQVFLSVGLAKVALKIGRKEHVEFAELFNGGAQFLPIFGFSFLLMFLMIAIGFGIGLVGFAMGDVGFALIIFGVLFIYFLYFLFLIFYWPFFFLVVDDKAKLFDSFSIAIQISKINIGNTFLLGFLSFGLIVLGYITCGIGLLFSFPLIIMLWTIAYLQMTGQIQAR